MENSSAVMGVALAEIIQNLSAKIVNGTTGAAKKMWQKAFADFDPFMRETYNRNSNVRILCQKDKDVNLYDVYVKSHFSCLRDKVDDDQLLYKIVEGKNVVINGNGGAGKTFLMRHLWISLFKGDTKFVPIFLELRKINELSQANVMSFIRLSISPKGEIDESTFSKFCDIGKFIFFLDGFDEVSREKRDLIQSQILEMAANFPECRFVVSSRYEKRFSGWQSFDLYESMPFNIKQVRELIRKLPFDDNSKKLFLKTITDEFYKSNSSFLANPLLATMMLMTFRENMDIPKKMVNFYDQAFVTLYQQHDAIKLYKREKSLDIIDFQRSFAIFCLLSYAKEIYEFSQTEIIDFISKSNKVCGIEIPPQDILYDYEESVNLIRQEGLNYVFIHRSFQEYFSAYALMFVVNGKFEELIPEIKKRTSDNVLAMCYEMNRSVVVDNYVAKEYSLIKERGTFLRNQGRYSALSRVSAEYKFRFMPDNEQEGFVRLYSMGIDMDFNIANFIDNINNIMSESKERYYSFSRDILMRGDIFSIFTGKRFEMKTTDTFYVSVSFNQPSGPAKVNYDDNEKKNTAFEEEINSIIYRNEKKFESAESEIRNIIRRVENWCSSEIAGSIERGKSLDEILSI